MLEITTLGDWVLIRFPHEESGKQLKLSKPWHGPYRIIRKNDPDVTAVPVYFPESGSIQVHQSRVCPCPPKCPTAFIGMVEIDLVVVEYQGG